MYKFKKHIEGGSSYDRRISRLTDRVKYAIFFAHTATKANYTTLDSNCLANSKETLLDSSLSHELDNCSDSTHSYTTNQFNDFSGIYTNKNGHNNRLTGDHGRIGHGSFPSDTHLDEYEDVDGFEDSALILKSTKKCRDELVKRLNNSYDRSADIKLLYSLSPIDYRISSLRDALSQLNDVNKMSNLM